MAIWVGVSEEAVGGHEVIPIKWDAKSGSWQLGKLTVATTVRVYTDLFPLRMAPTAGSKGKSIDEFVEQVFEPLLEEGEGGTDNSDDFEVEKVVDSRMRKGVRQYQVKWKGYDESENTWEPAEHLRGSTEAVGQYEKSQMLAAVNAAVEPLLGLPFFFSRFRLYLFSNSLVLLALNPPMVNPS